MWQQADTEQHFFASHPSQPDRNVGAWGSTGAWRAGSRLRVQCAAGRRLRTWWETSFSVGSARWRGTTMTGVTLADIEFEAISALAWPRLAA